MTNRYYSEERFNVKFWVKVGEDLIKNSKNLQKIK